MPRWTSETTNEREQVLIDLLAEAYVAGYLEAMGGLYIAPDKRLAALLSQARAEASRIMDAGEAPVAPARQAVSA